MSVPNTIKPTRERPAVRVSELTISAVTIARAARDLADYCRSEERERAARPLYSTSINGQVISLCWRSRETWSKFRAAEIIHCDGQPIVMLSRLLARTPLPERVATTDLFPEMARLAAERGLTFYMLGASADANARAVAQTRARYPGIRIVGARDGYFTREEEPAIIAEIAALKPDVLWVSLGVPFEQDFCVRNLDALRGVGVVKTSGGLFDFLSLEKQRAPDWMQRAGLEWFFRLCREPRRLFMRYLLTNPHAVYVALRSLR